MAIQLTPEQEARIQAVVNTGAYHSSEDAVEAAVWALESLSARTFEGTDEELERLLIEGLESETMSEEEFWKSIEAETGAMMAEYKRKHRS